MSQNKICFITYLLCLAKAPEFIWKKPVGTVFQVKDFDESESGVNNDILADGCSVMDSFDTAFDREFFAKVKMETNQYARQQMNES